MNDNEAATIRAAREKRLLDNWYVVHVQDRRSWNAEPLTYDKWYLQDGQRLLLDYYRELADDLERMRAVIDAADALIDAVHIDSSEAHDALIAYTDAVAKLEPGAP